jgi:hypothetical protein
MLIEHGLHYLIMEKTVNFLSHFTHLTSALPARTWTKWHGGYTSGAKQNGHAVARQTSNGKPLTGELLEPNNYHSEYVCTERSA